MKSNDERVKNIIGKAKRYKNKRMKAISATTLCLCALVAVVVQVKFNNRFIDKKVEQNLAQDDKLIVAQNQQEEKFLPAFESKEELVKVLREMTKENERSYGVLFGGSDADSFVVNDAVQDMQVATETAKGAPSFSKTNEYTEAESDDSYSETNTQVQGVDESDIVKTNGKNIFYLSSKDNTLKVFDNESDEIKLVHEIELGGRGYGSQMYLDDKFIVVLSNADIKEVAEADNEKNMAKVDIIHNYRDVTKVSIFDINNYELLREIETEGGLVSSRKIGEDIYIVTNKYISLYNFNEDNILPLYKDTLTNSGEYVEVAATDIRYFEDFKEAKDCNYMIITSFSLDDMESEVSINTYLGAGSEVYCSRENLYVAKVNYEYSNSGARKIAGLFTEAMESADISTTNIHKFSINQGKIKYVATGKVSGRLLNQFSMDEYDGYFRITTTNNDTGNNLFVLDEDLEQVGSVENLASGEKIYATRFMGDKAYVVTYKTVDPLFVIDLGKPESPKVLGELKIPGYSSYLHPLGENYLIGFGEDSVEKSYLNWEGEQEIVAYATGLKMAIFDVSNLSEPKELYSVKIGGRGSYSELLYNHKALLYDEEEGIFAFPATLTSEAGSYADGTPMYGDVIFNGALVYDVSVDGGITLRGKISHGASNKRGNGIERIIYIGDRLYTISNSMIMASDIDTVEMISELEF